MPHKTTFEDLHPNHKWAFIDGLLTGALLFFLTANARKNYKEMTTEV